MRGRNSAVIVIAIVTLAHCSLRTDQKYWLELAENELEEALKVQWNLNKAKNVILFIGDGMGPNTVTAARIHKGGESHRLEFEKFPHVGLLKTYSANKMVPDSASTATALFNGVKVNYKTVGVDASVERWDCAASLRPEARLQSLAALALVAGKSAGFVTTMRVTHATPAPLYAHSADRSWECDSAMPVEAAACKDTARQLVEDWPGKDFNVILGGGRQSFITNATGTAEDPTDSWSCSRKDGRNLIQEYKKDKETRGLKYAVVSNTRELKELSDDTDYLLGIFSNRHLSYEFERNKGPEGQPSISEMVEAALNVLEKNENGYFLMVEGGNIDMAHHRGRAKTAVSEAEAMEEAIRVAAERAGQDTLLVVTSDHTHTLSINGYPSRGANIFGIAMPSTHDGVNYTTLSYGTGGPGSNHNFVNGNQVSRREPGNTDDYYYEQVAGITLVENSHGGGDVIVYAKGPHAHLFHNIHEQHYVFHALCYAANLGAYSSAPVIAPVTWINIVDPTATKPEDLDEDAPAQIVDPNAVKPDDWLDDEPGMISDPAAKKPEDWDKEMDGEWEAPLIDNPKCTAATGCGTLKAPMITNPDYRVIN